MLHLNNKVPKCLCFILILLYLIILFSFTYLVVSPKKVKFYITNASLIEFAYTNNTLNYNFVLNIKVTNPNHLVAIYHSHVEALALYHDVEFSSQILGTFFQDHHKTTVLNPVFKGVMPLSEDQISKMKFESSSIYPVGVKLYMKNRYKVGSININPEMKLKVHCDLLVPLASYNEILGYPFRETKCHA
ncbi:hypothetical protein VNO78_33138 [Psophocarpus tetragonolobus]|uniref:Late embryogenesis abundant protein LEA-2 subgroup domain-containing protein n=1 Tax=Psophocarpus tetragonolobus TaxID=3891 RepID=A0AAN9P1L6_PSOTE